MCNFTQVMKHILVTNDDGIFSPGIKALTEEAMKLGKVTIVAPDKAQSGMGHAITMEHPIRIRKVDYMDGVNAYSCSGTPVDCVKLALDKIFTDVKPDLCLSGINHGANTSINVIYSGTMSAAMEAAVQQIPSIGFSLLNFSHEADMSAASEVVEKVLKLYTENGLGGASLLNVNIPDIPSSEIRGMKIARQAKGKWSEDFDKRVDPFSREYYWLTGKFTLMDDAADCDIKVLEEGYVSIVPTQFDLTDRAGIDYMKEKWDIG